MHKKQLESIKHHVVAALQSTNFAGMFTQEIRDATYDHRRNNIAAHLNIALNTLDIELQRCDKRINRRRAKDAKRKEPAQYRAPYKDD